MKIAYSKIIFKYLYILQNEKSYLKVNRICIKINNCCKMYRLMYQSIFSIYAIPFVFAHLIM